MDLTDRPRQLMQIFLSELEEHVQTLNEGLLALEKGLDDREAARRLDALFRAAHTLKGAARSVGVTPVEGVCHELEGLLDAVRAGGAVPAFERLFAAVDAVADAGQQLRAGRSLDAEGLARQRVRLRAEGRHDTGVASRALQPSEPERRVAPPSVGPRVPASPGPAVAPASTSPSTGRRETLAREVTRARGDDGGVVRISTRKLDALAASSGELLLARHRMASRLGELTAVHALAEQHLAEWAALEHSVEALRRRSASDGARRASSQVVETATARVANAGERLRRLERDFERLTTSWADDSRLLAQSAAALDADVHRARMLPFSEAVSGLERAARDVAKAGGKLVELVVEGRHTEIDRALVEGLREPLLHLVRNAVDHGIEAPSEREALGKPPTGTLRIAIRVRGARVEVTVSDDGRGLDLDAIRALADERQLGTPATAADLAQLAFSPGFSTAQSVTELSGRGFGLDAVRAKVAALRGTIDFQAATGPGTTLLIAFPRTLTSRRVLLVRASGQTLALDLSAVEKILRVPATTLQHAGGLETVSVNDHATTVVSLAWLLGSTAAEPAHQGGTMVLVVVGAANDRRALIVDEVLAEQELVVKALGPRLANVRLLEGATILPNGKAVPLLSTSHLIARSLDRHRARHTAIAQSATPRRRRLLVVDDSVTSRTLLQALFESAGYGVSVAVDGAEAWRLLQEGGTDVLVSDVEMPRVDGFRLTATVRSSDRFRDLPIVLVTARARDEDRLRGMELGANAYLVKDLVDQNELLDTVSQLL